MQALTLAMLVVVTTFEYLAKGDPFGRFALLPGAAAYVAELLSGVALVYVMFLGARTRFQFVRPAYWVVFGALLITVICGVVVNEVAPGAVFAGIRSHFRAIPWFFVPAVFAFTGDQLRTQLRLLLAIGLLQIPLAVEQTIKTTSRGFEFTGDFTSGTLKLSPTLTVFLVAAACIAAALMVRKRLSVKQAILLVLLLLFPTTINETKVTLVLVPIGLLIALLAAAKAGQRAKYVIVACALVALFGAIFFPVYNYLIAQREYSVPIGEMMSDPSKLERYLWQKTDVGTRQEAGRVDSVVVSLRLATVDPVHAAFGYGIGNASESALGRGYSGRYASIFGPFAKTSFGFIVIETGLLGLSLVLGLMSLILRDSLAVARRQTDLFGGLAAGWSGVTLVVLLAIPYTTVLAMTSLSFIFWYLSGIVAAARVRSVAAEAAAERRKPASRLRVWADVQQSLRKAP